MRPRERVLRCELSGEELHRHVERLYGKEALEALAGYIPLYCSGGFTEVYLLRQQLLDAVRSLMSSGRVPYYSGLYAGRLRTRRPLFIPSHLLIEKLHDRLGKPVRAFAASEQGIKVLMYGKDLLKESLVSCYEPIEVGEVVSVLGPDRRVYAIGLSEISRCSELDRLSRVQVVARTIFDLGWYLRGGTIPREPKYRV
jgi:ribosome biogenesis protein Nip4